MTWGINALWGIFIIGVSLKIRSTIPLVMTDFHIKEVVRCGFPSIFSKAWKQNLQYNIEHISLILAETSTRAARMSLSPINIKVIQRNNRKKLEHTVSAVINSVGESSS